MRRIETGGAAMARGAKRATPSPAGSGRKALGRRARARAKPIDLGAMADAQKMVVERYQREVE